MSLSNLDLQSSASKSLQHDEILVGDKASIMSLHYKSGYHRKLVVTADKNLMFSVNKFPVNMFLKLVVPDHHRSVECPIF